MFPVRDAASVDNGTWRGEQKADEAAEQREAEHGEIRSKLRDLAEPNCDDLMGQFVQEKSDTNGDHREQEGLTHCAEFGDSATEHGFELGSRQENGECDPERYPGDPEIAEFDGAKAHG
jgi:hypothetical protein